MWFLAGVLLVSREVLSAAERDNRAAFSRQTFLYDWAEGRCSLQSNAHSCRCMEKIAVFDPSSIVWWGPTTLYWISHKICFVFFFGFLFSLILRFLFFHHFKSISVTQMSCDLTWRSANQQRVSRGWGTSSETAERPSAINMQCFAQAFIPPDGFHI